MAKDKKPARPGIVLGAIVMLLIVAGMFLSAYTYGGPGLSKTWPAVFAAIGLWFIFGGMLEVGIGLIGIFGLWLASNLGYGRFGRLWPFLILLVAVLVAVGYIRSRARRSGD